MRKRCLDQTQALLNDEEMIYYSIRKFFFSAIISVAFFAPALATLSKDTIKLDHNIIVKKITDRTFVAIDQDYRFSNVLITKIEDGTIFLASSPFENAGTETLLGWIQKTLKPKHMVVTADNLFPSKTGKEFDYGCARTWSIWRS